MAVLMLTPPVTNPLLVGLSGGLDSSVLLHLLTQHPATRELGLRAIHIHHGLHADADAWAAHCQAACDALAVPLTVVRVHVAADSGLGVEGAARAARHAAFADALHPDEIRQIEQLKVNAAQVYSSIVNARQLGTDYLFADGTMLALAAPRVDTKNDHGTGCTLAAAITAHLAKGCELREAVGLSKEYLNGALEAGRGLAVGNGRGPVHHFYRWW